MRPLIFNTPGALGINNVINLIPTSPPLQPIVIEPLSRGRIRAAHLLGANIVAAGSGNALIVITDGNNMPILRVLVGWAAGYVAGALTLFSQNSLDLKYENGLVLTLTSAGAAPTSGVAVINLFADRY